MTSEDVTTFCHLTDDGRLLYMRDGCLIELFRPVPIGLGRTLKTVQVGGEVRVMMEQEEHG